MKAISKSMLARRANYDYDRKKWIVVAHDHDLSGCSENCFVIVGDGYPMNRCKVEDCVQPVTKDGLCRYAESHRRMGDIPEEGLTP